MCASLLHPVSAQHWIAPSLLLLLVLVPHSNTLRPTPCLPNQKDDVSGGGGTQGHGGEAEDETSRCRSATRLNTSRPLQPSQRLGLAPPDSSNASQVRGEDVRAMRSRTQGTISGSFSFGCHRECKLGHLSSGCHRECKLGHLKVKRSLERTIR